MSLQWREQQEGFTLMELMITVAIVGILAGIAYPSYLSHITSARRSEATSALLAGAQALERYYSSNGRYTTTMTSKTLPSVYPAKVPENGSAYYSIAVQGDPSANAFQLRASRTGSMTGDACGDFILDETGAMSLVDKPSGSSKSLADCWRR